MSPRARLAALASTVRRHPRAAGGLTASLACASLFGVFAMTAGAGATAATPAPSQGRLLQVVVAARAPTKPVQEITYSLLPTLAADGAPNLGEAQPIPLDPDLASAQDASAMRFYLEREVQAQNAALAEIRRADARAARTMAEAPTWTPPPAPAADAPA